jgi:hypothetical protein
MQIKSIWEKFTKIAKQVVKTSLWLSMAEWVDLTFNKIPYL